MLVNPRTQTLKRSSDEEHGSSATAMQCVAHNKVPGTGDQGVSVSMVTVTISDIHRPVNMTGHDPGSRDGGVGIQTSDIQRGCWWADGNSSSSTTHSMHAEGRRVCIVRGDG